MGIDMDMFVSVAVFVFAVCATLLGYAYVKRREAKIIEKRAEEEMQKAWKKEQNRQRRAAKKVVPKADQWTKEQIAEIEARQQQNISEQQANAAWIKPEWTQQ